MLKIRGTVSVVIKNRLHKCHVCTFIFNTHVSTIWIPYVDASTLNISSIVTSIYTFYEKWLHFIFLRCGVGLDYCGRSPLQDTTFCSQISTSCGFKYSHKPPLQHDNVSMKNYHAIEYVVWVVWTTFILTYMMVQVFLPLLLFMHSSSAKMF